MEIYGSMLIPVIACVVLALFFHHKTKVWEFAVPLFVSFLLCMGAKWAAESYGTHDIEIWGGVVTDSRYYEKWDEYVHKTCSTTSCSGSGKNQTCTTSYYDCSYVDDHPAHWTILDSNGATHRVTQATYHGFVKQFGAKPTFKDLRRSYHSYDGDMYYVNWPKTDETVTPVSTSHSWENRVQAAGKTTFSFLDVTEADVANLGLMEYPKVSLFDYPAALGNCGSTMQEGNNRLRFHNAMMGARKKLRMWFLCFDSHDPVVGRMQEALWVGGNKNEVVVTVGTDGSGSINWVHPFSWADDKTPLIEIRDHIVGQGSLDLVDAANFMSTSLEAGFVKKDFHAFDYLQIQPPTWAIVTTYILQIMLNVGLAFWLINNDFHEGRRAVKITDMFRGSRRRRY